MHWKYIEINISRSSEWNYTFSRKAWWFKSIMRRIFHLLLVTLCKEQTSKYSVIHSVVNNGRSSDKSDRFYVAAGHLKIEIQLMSDQIFVQLKSISYCYKNIKTFLWLLNRWTKLFLCLKFSYRYWNSEHSYFDV